MAKSEWGAKHICEGCGVKYYDMRRNPITCPSCGEKAAIVSVRPRRGRNAVKPQPATPPADGTATAADGADSADAAFVENDDDDQDGDIAAIKLGGAKES